MSIIVQSRGCIPTVLDNFPPLGFADTLGCIRVTSEIYVNSLTTMLDDRK